MVRPMFHATSNRARLAVSVSVAIAIRTATGICFFGLITANPAAAGERNASDQSPSAATVQQRLPGAEPDDTQQAPMRAWESGRDLPPDIFDHNFALHHLKPQE